MSVPETGSGEAAVGPAVAAAVAPESGCSLERPEAALDREAAGS